MRTISISRRVGLEEGLVSANGATSFVAWGSAPGKRAIETLALKARFIFVAQPSELNRAFSAVASLDQNPGAMPQAGNEKAPLALNRCLQRQMRVRQHPSGECAK
jgi:hypothetical protein